VSGEAVPARFSLVKFARSLVGLILAPIAGGLIVILGYNLLGLAWLTATTGWPQDTVNILVSSATIGAEGGAVLGVVPALVLGWPIHLLLRQRQTHVLIYIALGAAMAVAGFFVLAPIVLGPVWGNTSDISLDTTAIIGAAGAIGALVFWFSRRPDRDFALASATSTPQPLSQ
jgi:hypothetical protein